MLTTRLHIPVMWEEEKSYMAVRVKRVMVRKSKILGVYFILNFLFFYYPFVDCTLSLLTVSSVSSVFPSWCYSSSEEPSNLCLSVKFQALPNGTFWQHFILHLWTVVHSMVCSLPLQPITSSLYFSGTQQCKCFLVPHRAIFNRLVPKYHLRSTEMQQHLML